MIARLTVYPFADTVSPLTTAMTTQATESNHRVESAEEVLHALRVILSVEDGVDSTPATTALAGRYVTALETAGGVGCIPDLLTAYADELAA